MSTSDEHDPFVDFDAAPDLAEWGLSEEDVPAVRVPRHDMIMSAVALMTLALSGAGRPA